MQAQAEPARTAARLGAPGEDNALLREAKAALETAKLNLEFTAELRETQPVPAALR